MGRFHERGLSSADLTDAASTLVGSYSSKLNSVNTSGVVRQSGFMMLGCLCGLLAYLLILQPKFGGQIAPKARKLAEKLNLKTHAQPEKNDKALADAKTTSRSIENAEDSDEPYFHLVGRAFTQFFDILTMSEAYQLMDCGLDSVVYLRLLWLNLSIFTFISLCTVPTLVPLDWKDHRPDKTWSIETLSQASLNDLTIQKVKGKALYFHIILLYAITFIVFFLIWWNCKAVESLRVKFLTNPSYLHLPADHFKRSALIADLGPKTSDPRVQEVYEKKLQDPLDIWLPNEDEQQHKRRLQREAWKEAIELKIAEKAKKVLEDIDTDVVHPFELRENVNKVVVQVFDTPDPVGRAERMERRNELVEQLQYAITKHLKVSDKDQRILIREPGPLAMFKNKVDALSYYRTELAKCWKPINEQEHYYALIAFPCCGYLSLFIEASASMWVTWKVDWAPPPNGIIWANIRSAEHLRPVKYMTGYGVLLTLLVVYSGPITVIALLSNVGAVTVYFPLLDGWSHKYPTLFIALTSTVPPALSAVLFSVLPYIIHFIAHKQGAKTFLALQTRIIHWYLAFVILAQLVIFPSLSTIFTLLTQKDPNQQSAQATGIVKVWAKIVYFFAQIPNTYQTQANYWLNWLAMRWFLAVFQLVQGPILARKLLEHVYRKITAQGKADHEAEPAEYEKHIPQAMFQMALGLLYAPLVPLMSVFSAIAMVLLYSVHKVQAILLYHTETETLGAFWLPEMDRILAFLFLSQGLLGLTCGLQNASGKTGMLVLPAMIFTVLYRFWLRYQFNDTLKQMLHPWAMHQTADKHIEKHELLVTYGFEPKGVRIEFEESIRAVGEELLRKNGLGRLLEAVDEEPEEIDSLLVKGLDKASRHRTDRMLRLQRKGRGAVKQAPARQAAQSQALRRRPVNPASAAQGAFPDKDVDDTANKGDAALTGPGRPEPTDTAPTQTLAVNQQKRLVPGQPPGPARFWQPSQWWRGPTAPPYGTHQTVPRQEQKANKEIPEFQTAVTTGQSSQALAAPVQLAYPNPAVYAVPGQYAPFAGFGMPYGYWPAMTHAFAQPTAVLRAGVRAGANLYRKSL